MIKFVPAERDPNEPRHPSDLEGGDVYRLRTCSYDWCIKNSDGSSYYLDNPGNPTFHDKGESGEIVYIGRFSHRGGSNHVFDYEVDSQDKYPSTSMMLFRDLPVGSVFRAGGKHVYVKNAPQYYMTTSCSGDNRLNCSIKAKDGWRVKCELLGHLVVDEGESDE